MKTLSKILAAGIILTSLLAPAAIKPYSQAYGGNMEDSYKKTSVHNHSKYSLDPGLRKFDLEAMISLCEQKDVRIIALTDNNSDQSYIDLVTKPELVPSNYTVKNLGQVAVVQNKNDANDKIYFVRGMELRGSKGHIIILGNKSSQGLADMIKSPDYNNKDVVALAHSYGAIVEAPHPFSTEFKLPGYSVNFGGMGEKELLNVVTNKDQTLNVDAIEICNGYNANIIVVNASKCNDQAKRFKQEHGIAGIAAPDSHMGDIDICYFKMPSSMIDESSGEAFIESLRKAMMMTKDNAKCEQMNHEGTINAKQFFNWYLNKNKEPK